MKDQEFWIVNISNRNVTLSDLNLSIKAGSSVNLLDKKHYHLTMDQLQKSLTSGSIYKKRDKIFKRVVPPTFKKDPMAIDMNAVVSSRSKSIFEIKEERFEELEFTDEQYFASEGSEDDSIGEK
jgi:hypothetical protein